MRLVLVGDSGTIMILSLIIAREFISIVRLTYLSYMYVCKWHDIVAYYGIWMHVKTST